jgi:hypothetical protein
MSKWDTFQPEIDWCHYLYALYILESQKHHLKHFLQIEYSRLFLLPNSVFGVLYQFKFIVVKVKV